jgi:hypothetical protein
MLRPWRAAPQNIDELEIDAVFRAVSPRTAHDLVRADDSALELEADRALEQLIHAQTGAQRRDALTRMFDAMRRLSPERVEELEAARLKRARSP